MFRMDADLLCEKGASVINERRVKSSVGSGLIMNPSANYLSNYHSAWGTSNPQKNEENRRRTNLKNWWWWQPEKDSISAEFLDSSTMHGLQYLAQPNRHILERLFWLLSYVACVIGAVLMILEIWSRYYLNPVIVTFNPEEQRLDTVPFPAITICNTNPIPKKTVMEYLKEYNESITEETRSTALDALRLINGICVTQKSFFQKLNYSRVLGQLPFGAEEGPSSEMEKNLTQFMLSNSQPCSELLRHCVWGQETQDCSTIFQPIITDYGKCCTFNMMPQDILQTNHSVTQKVLIGHKSDWSWSDIDEWKKWDYANDGYKMTEDLKYPYRQRRAGASEGLSLLIDPDTENDFCPSTDSEGVKLLYHLPIERPRVADLGSVIGLGKEVFFEINPDLTIANPEIAKFHRETRKCYFGSEYELQFYSLYTRSNCMEECWTKILIDKCNCVSYYFLHNSTTEICSTTNGTDDYNCVKETEAQYLDKLDKECPDCKFSCNYLTYNSEMTSASLRHRKVLWELTKGAKENWMSHKLTVLHVFMGSDSTVPKLRAKLYQTVDLIANTGGLLGLCIGFSILSAVEIVYFATLRVCCKRLRKRRGIRDEEDNRAIPG